MSMDTSHSVCLNVGTESNFEIADKLLPVSNMASSRSEDLEEAMFETGKSLSAISKFDSVLEINQPIYIFLHV